MSKIELPTVTGNNNISRINDNFKKIEDVLNQEVLYRKSYVGEPNEMDTNLDMNGKEILNVATGTSDGSLVTKSYVDQGLSLKFDKSGGPLSGPVDMQNNQINNLPNATQPSQPATYAQLLQVESAEDSLLRQTFIGPDGKGLYNFFGGGGWTGADVAGQNIYNNGTITYTNALRQRYSVPISPDPLPIQWLEKTTSATRDDSVQRWDQGCSYHSLTKNGGSAFGATDTSVAKNLAGAGQLIAKHMRGESRHVDAETWGGWSYGAVLGGAAATGAKGTVAHEFNLNNQGPDKGWMQTADVGAIRGLICVTQDNSNPVTQMIVVGRGSAAPNGYIWTGALFRADSFVTPTEALTEVGNGEAIRLEGSALALASNGIRFRGGTFRVGVALSESAYSNNCAILLGDNHRITVGTGPANTTYLAFNRTENWANFQNMNIRTNGVKVVGARQTGFARMTGTPLKTSFNADTATLQQVAQRLKAIEDALHADSGHGLYGLT